MSEIQPLQSESNEELETRKSQDNKRSVKRKRLTWTNELHLEFLHAVDLLGVRDAKPAKILEILDGKGLDKNQISSHLQKYRTHLGNQDNTKSKGIPSIFDSGPEDMISRHKAELRMYEHLRIPNFPSHQADSDEASSKVRCEGIKHKAGDTQKGIKLTVEITIDKNSSTLDSMPQDVMNGNVYETQMLDNHHTAAFTESTSNAAGRKVAVMKSCKNEINSDQAKNKGSDGSKRGDSKEKNILKTPLDYGNEPEEVVKGETVNISGHRGESVHNINIPQDLVSDNQQEVKTTARVCFGKDIEMYTQLLTDNRSETGNIRPDVQRSEKVDGNSSTVEYSDMAILGRTSNFTNLMTDNGTNAEEKIVPLQNLNRIKPDQNKNSVPMASSSDNVNEHLGLPGNVNPNTVNDDAGNNEICIASDVTDAEDKELLENLDMKTILYLLGDKKW